MNRQRKINTKDKVLWGIKNYLGPRGEFFLKSIDQIEDIADYVDNHGMQIQVVLKLMEWIGGKDEIANPIAYLQSILLDYAKKGILTMDEYERHLERRANGGAHVGEGMAEKKERNDKEGDLQKAIDRKTEQALRRHGRL